MNSVGVLGMPQIWGNKVSIMFEMLESLDTSFMNSVLLQQCELHQCTVGIELRKCQTINV